MGSTLEPIVCQFLNISLMTYFHKIFLFSFLLFGLSVSNIFAQNQRKDILEDLMQYKVGQGRVMVFEDNAIKNVLGRSMSPNRKVYSKDDGEQYVKMRGFKIQAFSGNSQRTSKNEASTKQRMINEAYPEHETVVTFDSPFWRLRVGNFRTREEANRVLEEMKKTFTSFGREMYVVVDEVKILVN